MAHPYLTDPVVSELDEIAQELEKTGNADLATLVDEVSAELMTSQRRTVAAKKPVAKPAKKDEKPAVKGKKNGKKPGKREAEVSPGSRRAKIASAMRKIARAQVSELEDIAAELLKEGDKKAALEVLKIAEDLDSDYEYSAEGKHSSPESKGDASKRFDREKANKPDAKMDAEEKERLDLPFGEKGEGYPLKQSAFDKQLDNLIRLATEGLEEDPAADKNPMVDASDEDSADDDMDMSQDSEDASEDSDSDEDSDEDDGDLDMTDLDSDDEGGSDEESGDSDADDMDLKSLDLGDGDDELAAMMDAMDSAEPHDTEASDRMYGAEDSMDEDEDGEDGSDPAMPPAPGAEHEDLMDGEEEDDMEADMMPGAAPAAPPPAGGAPAPVAVAAQFSAADKTKMAELAKKLAAKGEKGLAARVAKLAKK